MLELGQAPSHGIRSKDRVTKVEAAEGVDEMGTSKHVT